MATKRMNVPSVLVDCQDCPEVMELTTRTFDLAVEMDDSPGATEFRCDDCRDTDEDKPGDAQTNDQ